MGPAGRGRGKQAAAAATKARGVALSRKPNFPLFVSSVTSALIRGRRRSTFQASFCPFSAQDWYLNSMRSAHSVGFESSNER